MAFKPTYSQVKLSLKKTSFHFRRLSGWRWSKASRLSQLKFRWVGYMKTRGNQMMLLAIPWRYDSKLPTTISKRENENPRLFVAGCSVFDLKTLISEANQQSSPTSTLLSWQTSATLNRCLGGCQVLIPFLLVDWSASANAFEDISCFDLLPQQGF